MGFGAEQVEGSVVEVLPTSVCEAEYAPRGAETSRVLGQLVEPGGLPGAIEGVHAVYQLEPDPTAEPYWPSGEYAVVFVAGGGDQTWGTRVRIAEDRIVRIDFGCGRVAPEELGVLGAVDLLARTAAPLLGSGPGLSVGEALSSRLTGPLLVNGFIVIANGETRLCETLAESLPPQCGDPSLVVEGFEPDPGALREASGVGASHWSDDPVQVLGERGGERLVVSGNSLAN